MRKRFVKVWMRHESRELLRRLSRECSVSMAEMLDLMLVLGWTMHKEMGDSMIRELREYREVVHSGNCKV